MGFYRPDMSARSARKSPMREWFVAIGAVVAIGGFVARSRTIGQAALVLGLMVLNAGLIGLAVRSGD